MDILDQIEHLASLMHTLMYADEVPNTFGMTHEVARALQGIASSLTAQTPAAMKKRLDEVLTKVEQNRSVFAIPETPLIEAVYQQARHVRSRLGHGPFTD
jgi:hypothetical protein